MFDIVALWHRFRKHVHLQDVLIIIGIFVLFFSTRLIVLDRFPVFNDEGIYIHWAKIAKADAAWRFISLTDGKQPLQTWGTIPILKFFPTNALLAGRLFSVMTGFAALSGIIVLLTYLFGKRTAFIGGFLYVITPYFLFYDRMAMVDSGVNAAIIWIVFLSILLARTIRLDVAIIFGLVGGIGLLAKSSVRIFMGLAILAPILFYEKNRKKTANKVLNFVILYVLAAIIAFAIYNVQRLSPFFHVIAEKNTTFISTFAELRQNPFVNVLNNLQIIPQYVFMESAFLLPLLGIVGLIMLYKKEIRLALYLTLWIVIPFVIVCIVSKVLFPRYIIFFPTLFLIPAAFLIGSLRRKYLASGILIGLTIFNLYFNYTILFDYTRIPFPPVDRGQYIEGWPAGIGIKEIMEYAREKSKEKPVIILADGNFGLVGDVLDVHLQPQDKITIKGYWPLEEKELRENQKDIGKNHVFVVMAHKMEYPPEWPLKLIRRYDKPGNQSVIYLFQLTQ